MRNVFVLGLAAVLMTGCSSDPEVILSPSTMTFSMVAEDEINPNSRGHASPLAVKVFELEDDSMFQAAGFDQLATDFKDALSSNYVDDYDYMLLPGEFKYVDPIPLDEDTRFIGVMAKYTDSENSHWKRVVKVKPNSREYHLLIHFKGNEVKVKKVE